MKAEPDAACDCKYHSGRHAKPPNMELQFANFELSVNTATPIIVRVMERHIKVDAC